MSIYRRTPIRLSSEESATIWANRIVYRSNKFMFEGLNRDGSIALHPLEALQTIGVPISARPTTRRFKLQTCFNDWDIVDDASDFLSQFDFKNLPDVKFGQQIYRFIIDGQRYFLPVLTLMRCVFRTQTKFIPAVFQPNFFANSCFVSSDESGDEFSVLADWVTSQKAKDTLAWLVTYKTMRSFANSIYVNALKGRLAAALPNASLSLSIEGIHRDYGIYVSDISFDTLSMNEPPLISLKDFRLSGAVSQNPLASQNPSECEYVPRRISGELFLSDAEWKVIHPMLHLPTPRYQIKTDHRAVFNDILTKYENDFTWENVPCTCGKHERAAMLRKTWSKAGSLSLALNKLRLIRRESI